MTIKDEQQTLSIDKFLKIATSKQKELLLEIYENVEEEKEIVKRIGDIYTSIGNGMYITEKGITICENEDDANVISLKLKTDLKIVRTNIGTLLKRAIEELQMRNVGIIQRQYNNYAAYL